MATEPFYGDPATSAPVWSKYAVLLGSLTATTPTGTPTGATAASMGFILNDPAAGTPITTEWDPVGALDDDSPFDSGEESIEVTPHSAAGLGVYAKTFKNQEERFTFTALETTLTTLGLLYNASGITESAGVTSGKLKFRDPSETFRIGIVRHNATNLERRVSTNYAQIDTISRQGGEKSLWTVTVSVYPNAAQELFDYYLGPKA